MKKIILTLMASLVASVGLRADVITLWDFNFPTTATVFPSGDSDATTGTFTPLVGTGSFGTINVGATTFGNPPAGGGGATTDPWSGDNSALRMGTFPAQGTANKTAGAEFFTSTVGYENIQVTFDQENSATASKYWRVQYTADGSNWVDFVVLESGGSTAWVHQRLVDFSAVPAVKNNPNFGVRYVSEWVSTATGSGANSYVANAPGSNYGTGGTLWLDMVTVSGTPLDTSNADPTISAIADVTNRINQTIPAIAFTVGDAETPVDQLSLSATSSNPSLIQIVSLDGTGSNRTLTLASEPDQIGSSTITVIVTDGGGKAASSIFVVHVLPENTAPSISAFTNQIIFVNGSTGNMPFTISDLETPANDLILSTQVGDPSLIPPTGIVFSGTGNNRILTVTPAVEGAGATVVRVVVSDGTLFATNSFFIKVLRPETVALWNFNSNPPDTSANTGTFDPAIGSGTFTVIGGPVGTFGAQATTDPAATDNSALRTGDSFPAQGTENKTAGLEIRFSTVGFQNVAVTWDHHNSASGSRYWRTQYTTNGTDYVDHIVYTNPLPVTVLPAGVSFAGVPGVNDNPNFGFRLVSEWESTATGAGEDVYVGVQASGGYSTAGTLWTDMFLITADPLSETVQLQVSKTGSNVQISWPASASGNLYSTASLTVPNWQPVGTTPTIVGESKVVTVNATSGNQFFQLRD